MKKKDLGNLGEAMAKKYLQLHGMKIFDTQLRCRYGEVDIVAYDDDNIYFVEVKTRQTMEFGRPCESITRTKELRMRRCCEDFLSRWPNFSNDYAVNFKVIEILINDMDAPFRW